MILNTLILIFNRQVVKQIRDCFSFFLNANLRMLRELVARMQSRIRYFSEEIGVGGEGERGETGQQTKKKVGRWGPSSGVRVPWRTSSRITTSLHCRRWFYVKNREKSLRSVARDTAYGPAYFLSGMPCACAQCSCLHDHCARNLATTHAHKVHDSRPLTFPGTWVTKISPILFFCMKKKNQSHFILFYLKFFAFREKSNFCYKICLIMFKTTGTRDRDLKSINGPECELPKVEVFQFLWIFQES